MEIVKPWRVVSFHTDDVLYRWHIARLKESLAKFGIDNYVEEIPHEHGWVNTVNYKPEFILSCLEKFDENIVWLDADAVVQQYPALFDDIDADIAVHYKDNKELLSGTVWFNNSDKTKGLVRGWIDLRKNFKGISQPQRVLQEYLKNKNYSIYKLPAPYTLIFDLMSHQGPPVIEHFQASRKGRTM